MFPKDVLADEEREVDLELGYPRGYAKLCRHANIQMQGLITPYTEGPPQRFHPYAPLDEELAKLKEFDALFPILDEAKRDHSSAGRHATFLWQQLDHLGNAGFDPSKFRVDAYGNVLYWNADPGSPLAWEVDHWFPHSRGGRTVVSNLRIVQWQVNQRKSTKLEFLVPWWDLLMGVSVNQFLSVFSSKNIDFRQRAFSLFFLNGENEQLDENVVMECHSWPQPFRERKQQVGVAAAAVAKDNSLKALNNNIAVKQSLQQFGSGATLIRCGWTSNEEETLKKALQKFGPGNWKEIKEYEPTLGNCFTAQLKDKFGLMRGECQLDKENRDEPTDGYKSLTTSIQKEEQIKRMRAQQIKVRDENLVQLEEELAQIKAHNGKEKLILEDLERSLGKHRKRVEKQRRWAETQNQYRLCLEKMIRDTMHQCVLYKEQARLNQAACNSLLARLESQKSTRDAAETDLIRRVKQRQSLEALARPKITKRTRKEGHTDVGSCIKQGIGSKVVVARPHRTQGRNDLYKEKDEDRGTHRLERLKDPDFAEQVPCHSNGYIQNSDTPVASERGYDDPCVQGHGETAECSMAPVKKQGLFLSRPKDADTIKSKDSSEGKEPNEPEEQQENDCCQSQTKNDSVSLTNSNESAGMKRKALHANEWDVLSLMHEYGDEETGNCASKEAENHQQLLKPTTEAPSGRTKDQEQLDELLHEVLETKGKVHAAMEDAIEDDEDEDHRVKRVGKFNLDKWLQILLDPTRDHKPATEIAPQDNPPVKQSQATREHQLDARKRLVGEEDSMRGSMIGGVSSKQHQEGTEDASQELTSHAMPCKAGFQAEENWQSKITRRTNPWGCAAVSPSLKCPVSENVAPIRQKTKAPSENKDFKAEERKVIDRFSRLKLGGGDGGWQQVKDSSKEDSEVAFQIACEAEFVEKMRAAREREQRRRQRAQEGLQPRLRDLLGDSTSQEQQLLGCEEVSPSESIHCPALYTTSKIDRSVSLASPSPTKARRDEQRRRSMGAPVNPQITASVGKPSTLHIQQALTTYTLPSITTTHLIRHPCQPTPTSWQPKPERSFSTPPGTQFQTQVHPIVGDWAELRHIKSIKQWPSENTTRQLSRQQTTGHAVMTGGGGAARKASMLMTSASTRGGSPARSSSSSNGGRRVRRGGEEEEADDADEEVQAFSHRKRTLFQDWDASERLCASISHVWRNAVKKFDLARQQ